MLSKLPIIFLLLLSIPVASGEILINGTPEVWDLSLNESDVESTDPGVVFTEYADERLVCALKNATEVGYEDPEIIATKYLDAFTYSKIAKPTCPPACPIVYLVPDDYERIQWAIDNATTGYALIVIKSGTYYENLNVSKEVILMGVDTCGGMPVIDASGSGSPITLNANKSVVKGLKVANAGMGEAGIEVNSNHNVIMSNYIDDCWYGIYFDNAHNNTVLRNTFSYNMFGTYLSSSNSNEFLLNDFLGNSNDVYSFNSANTWNSTQQITYNYGGSSYTGYMGNYWDGYSGSDSDGDGIGDSSYSVGSGQDFYPLMSAWVDYFFEPIASMDFTPDNPMVNETIKLDASASSDQDGKIDYYLWSLSNDTIMTKKPAISLSYSAPKCYHVNLSVVDNHMQINKTSAAIPVGCGDVNCDQKVDISDVIRLLYYVGYPGQYSLCSEWAGDVTGDGTTDISDVIKLLYYVGYPGQYELECKC